MASLVYERENCVGDPSQMRRGPTGTDRRALSVPTVTTSQLVDSISEPGKRLDARKTSGVHGENVL